MQLGCFIGPLNFYVFSSKLDLLRRFILLLKGIVTEAIGDTSLAYFLIADKDDLPGVVGHLVLRGGLKILLH